MASHLAIYSGRNTIIEDDEYSTTANNFPLFWSGEFFNSKFMQNITRTTAIFIEDACSSVEHLQYADLLCQYTVSINSKTESRASISLANQRCTA
jgi:hypothetical protein